MPKRSSIVERIAMAAAFAVASLGVCAPEGRGAPAATEAPAQAAAPADAQEAIRQIVEESNPAYLSGSATLVDREWVAKLYETSHYRLLWSDGARPTAAALGLVRELRQAEDRGLNPADYPGERLNSMVTDLLRAPHPGEEQWALFDVSLSLAGLRFVTHLHEGRIDPASVGHNLTVPQVKLDAVAALGSIASAADARAALDAFEPQFIHYALLKRQLARYRGLAAMTGINDLPALSRAPHIKSLKVGDAYAGAAQLQRLLIALGDYKGGAPGADAPPASAPPQTLTPALVDAIEAFQSRHGEKPDGALGAATLGELRRPLNDRVRQIELTMERWRWLPSELASAPIVVNIPQFRLFAFDSTNDAEARIRQMDVIVGKAFEATQTPVFAADMKYLIFRPYWEVPYSIAVKEIVPEARANLASIEKHQMEIVRGSGESATVVPNTRENVDLVAKGVLRIRQRPGPDNSLGLVKFMFPNPYDVYLHSTPARSLFGRARRDFSHGCVRVSDPVGLAQYVLRDSPEWTREKIEAAMNGTLTVTVSLKNPIRVFIVYGTAVALEDGRILFFDDIYGHDQRLESALDSRRPRSPAPQAPGGG
jgi:murein L,D-transpeptidase YcbB/YkuD